MFDRLSAVETRRIERKFFSNVRPKLPIGDFIPTAVIRNAIVEFEQIDDLSADGWQRSKCRLTTSMKLTKTFDEFFAGCQRELRDCCV